MSKRWALEALDVGASIAEGDQNLRDYFVTTNALRDLVNDRYDIVRGAKGSGKSALLKIMVDNRTHFQELAQTHLVSATNHTGDLIFRVVFEEFEKRARPSNLSGPAP